MRDFCTFWPDSLRGVYYGKTCCMPHDRAYILGGVWRKLKADLALAKCVRDKGLPVNAAIMYIGVSILGWYAWCQERYLQWKYYGSSNDEL